MKNRYIVSCIALFIMLNAAGCVTGEYHGYAGYHTYKKDTDIKTGLLLLSVLFLPLVSIPAVYFVNDLYLHNELINTISKEIGLSDFFTELGKKLL